MTHVSWPSARVTHRGQTGQALAEALVATLVLGVTWVAVHWLFQYQDMALSTVHASRHAAFLATRRGETSIEPAHEHHRVERFFAGDAHRWVDRKGERTLDVATVPRSGLRRVSALSQSAQPAGEAPDTQALRQQWLLEDAGMVQARVALDFADAVGVANEYGPLGLALFDRPHDDLSRSLVILHGAGHATSDAAAQQRASSSWLAWGRAQATSHVAGQEVAVRAAGIDGGWNRGAPGFDWWSAWAGRVPGEHLQPYGGR